VREDNGASSVSSPIAFQVLMLDIYVGLLGYFGVVRNAVMRAPGIAIFVPVLVFLVLSISTGGSRKSFASSIRNLVEIDHAADCD
jgi:hypothetical protein